ncbi:MAG: MotA/TolQ/ExbB proton channel family protein [Ruminococcus albus]|nr:MotA/TolQ/ExbB proton channel family protein [Ruminococcus albus]
MDLEFVKKMAYSIVHQDFYILLFAGAAIFFFYKVRGYNNEIKDAEAKMADNPDWAKRLRIRLNFWYSLFTTSITIFPLLGMFGTVIALLNLKFASAETNMEDIKNNFFNALTSTAWGIVFSVAFKSVNAFIVSSVNDTITRIHEIVQEIESKDKKKKKVKTAKEEVADE